MNRKIVIVGFLIYALVTLWINSISDSGFKAEAEPSWARKYNAKCTLCHTTYPRLNRTGYDFRRLGYRLPGEISASQSTGAETSPKIVTAHEPFVIKPTGYKPKPESAESNQGKSIFENMNCSGCHSIAGKGGIIGPPLDGIGGRRSEEFLIAHITNPEEHAKKFPQEHGGQINRMPHPHASADEVRLIVAYLLTLPEPPAGFRITPHAHGEITETSPLPGGYQPAPATDSSRAGEKLYNELGCSSCHAIARNGGEFGPALDGIGALRSRNYIIAHITNAQVHAEQFPEEHKGEVMMPATEASPDQIAQIADFLMTLPLQETAQTPKKNQILDYLAVSYIPAVEVEDVEGETDTNAEWRELIIYAAGPVGKYFSFFVQPLPASKEEGFIGKFEMIQGLMNYGGSTNFLQIRFGQLFNLRGSGFGGTDRGLTETQPLLFDAVNGFNAGGLGRGGSVEYTLNRTTTLKGFGVSNEPGEEEEEAEESESLAAIQQEEPLVAELDRSATYGLILEKVLGEKGLSGIQFEFAGGNTPVLEEGEEITKLKFQRFSLFANKTFEDKQNFERLNTIFGISFLRDKQLLEVESDDRSHGYGFFAEVAAIPIVNHLTFYGRYDQLRPTTLVEENTIRAGTFGAIYDVVKYLRLAFEFRRVTNEETSNNYRFAVQLNY